VKVFTIDNEHWLGCYINGQLHLVMWLGKRGDRIRP
jgi:hypothetical protein